MSMGQASVLKSSTDLYAFSSYKKQSNPLPIQYLGSKSRIADWILILIKEEFPGTTHLLDLFSGSGSISIAAINHGIQPIANDVQPYSFSLLRSIFQSDQDEVDKIIATLQKNRSIASLLRSGRDSWENYLITEKHFLDNPDVKLTWEKYQDFCQSTKTVSCVSEITKLRLLGEWNLFSNIYSNTYFGIRQCLELDLIRELSNGLPDKQKHTLLGATISIMTQCVSGTTHLAQFLKVSSESTAKNIMKKRKVSIIDSVISRLMDLREFKVPYDVDVYNLDYLSLLKKSDYFSPTTIIYADPPYFKEHYSRYYHLLDTFYLYDYPTLTYNKRLNQITTGRYRDNRITSDFGLKSKVERAFHELFGKAKSLNLPIALSYANTSLVKKEKIMKIAFEHGFTSKLNTKELLHSGQGQKRNNLVQEYLFLFKQLNG